MNLEYATNKMKKTLNDEKLLKKEYGELATAIMSRHTLLLDASNLAEIPINKPERCHKLSGKYEGCFGIDVSVNWRMIIEPIGADKPYDKLLIKDILIFKIEDYH